MTAKPTRNPRGRRSAEVRAARAASAGHEGAIADVLVWLRPQKRAAQT